MMSLRGARLRNFDRRSASYLAHHHHHQHHHRHGHATRHSTSGVASFYGARRALFDRVIRIASGAPEISLVDRGRSGVGRRFLGTARTDDEFDLPPLDLMSSPTSLSIPLPPNMRKEAGESKAINGSTISKIDAVEFSDAVEIEALSSSSALSPLEDALKEANAPKVKEAVEKCGEVGGEGGGSFLSRGIRSMKERLGCGGRSSSTKRRGGGSSELLANRSNEGGATTTGAAPGVDGAETGAGLSFVQHLKGRLPSAVVDRRERLECIKREIQSVLDEDRRMEAMRRKMPAGRRAELLAKLNGTIGRMEEAFLRLGPKIDAEEEDKIIHRLAKLMSDIHNIEEYGLSPTQSRNRREKHDMMTFTFPSAPPDPVRARPSPTTAPRPSPGPGGFPSPDFDRDLIATQADGSVLGRSGGTSVLATVVLARPWPSSHAKPPEERGRSASARESLLGAIRRADAESGATSVPLRVEYRERHHAAGRIPPNRRRRDGVGPPSDGEVLAARAVDRAVRPWLMTGVAELGDGGSPPEDIAVHCEVQSYDPRPSGEPSSGRRRAHADPTALAVNSAIAALYRSAYSGRGPALPVPAGAAGCVRLAVMEDGTAIFDPAPGELEESAFELLYAGTRDRALMIEFSVNEGRRRSAGDPGAAEGAVADALRLAQEAIVPVIEEQERLRDEHAEETDARKMEGDESLMTDEEVARLLGLEVPSPVDGPEAPVDLTGGGRDDGARVVEEANSFVWSRAKHAALKLFGDDGAVESSNGPAMYEGTACVHDGDLLPKRARGRRENALRAEIARLLRDEFSPSLNGELAESCRGGWENALRADISRLQLDESAPSDGERAESYRTALRDGDGAEECAAALAAHVHERTMKRAMAECAGRDVRSDGRPGRNVVRPIRATAPVFPDSVHGSSVFSRGETQVLCTATIGAPREGLPMVDPFAERPDGAGSEESSDDEGGAVPVGSLRFLRSQAEMESDMNSRRVRAGRETTGDSGILSEVKRAFLHYDFPDFSTGEVKSRAGASANRRAIGHGNLAEKAVLPILPSPNDFPYAIRLTCEVTSSNGSSSMASACGATLALLDAGVPLASPVAGVSVGLAPGSDELLLDITGTEDHYGDMDFKICGTHGGITAMQLDVKRPLPLDSLLAALDLAREGRRAILNAMEDECKDTLPGLRPRPSMKSTAPRVEVIEFDPNRKRDLIGPGGAVLRQLEDRFGASLDLSQEGRCLVFGSPSSVSRARGAIMDLVSDVEEGGVYEGTVIDIKDFGAIVELLRNKEGLLHVSEIVDSSERHPGGNIGLVKEHLKVGDKIEVLCTKIDQVQGSIKLSRKKLLRMRENVYSPPRLNDADAVESISVNQGESLPTSSDASIDSWAEAPEESNDTGDWLSFSDDTQTEVSDGKYENEIQDMMHDRDISDEVEDYHVENDPEEIAQWISTTGDESDEDGSVDADSDDDDDSIGMGADVVDDEKSLESTDGVSSFEARWMERYEELKQYKSAFGHCNVPSGDSKHPKLANFVKWQRRQFKNGNLSHDRVTRLNDIGFAWSFERRNDAVWEQRLDELKQYKSAFGHCNVPRGDSEHPELGNFVKWQREQYKNGNLPHDRVTRLNDIGFAWSADMIKDAIWEQRLGELKQYKSAVGHCNVPWRSSEHPELSYFVRKQRAQYKNGSLTDDRIERLNDIGFEWSLL